MIAVRQTEHAPEVSALYQAAFPEEDLTGVVADLLALEDKVLSVGAYDGSRLVGHVIFTRGTVGRALATLLGPLAVHPDRQRQGVGAALIAEGLAQVQKAGAVQAFVLGDPTYYARSGFMEEDRVRPPCPIPIAWQSAWQSQTLGGAAALGPGVLELPAPWRDPALWTE